MKNVKKSLAALMLGLGLVVGGSSVATAQTSSDDVNNVVSGLLVVDINQVNVDVNDVITIGDVTITDVINVNNVLNRSEIRILTDFLNDVSIDIDDVLTNVLRDANILNKNQIVVGLLSDQVSKQGQLIVINQNQR